jgi:hypothetical protein
MKVGAHTLCARSSVLPARTLYSFTAGDEGLQFLNFRPRRDMTYITKDELMQERRRAPRCGVTICGGGDAND